MIKNNDTLLFKQEIEICEGDTSYHSACWTFEIQAGQIINQRDQNCVPQGHWIITDSLGNYSTGDYKDGKANRLWKSFNKSGKLLNEKEHFSIGWDTYITKEIEYSSGQAITIIDKPFLTFYLKNLIAIAIILFLSFFSRLFINSKIYNIENGTNLSPIYFHLGPLVTSNFGHSLLCTFSFWFSNYKPQNRRLVFITNTLSVISLGIFFGAIIGLVIEGDIWETLTNRQKRGCLQLHLLICFIALLISKNIKLKTETSIKSFIHECKKITDARLKNKITGKEIIMRANSTSEIQEVLKKLDLLT